MSNVYQINKGVNRPIVFKGLKAQYIWWLGGGILSCLLLFTLLYITGLSLFICVPVTLGLGGVWFAHVYKLNRKYGVHGMAKKIAFNMIPKWIKCDKLFNS